MTRFRRNKQGQRRSMQSQIRVSISRNHQGQIYGFTAYNHGMSIVCAAVSALVLNTVNSIEEFTEEEFMPIEIPENGVGYLKLCLPGIEAGNDNRDVDLLLSSMLLGLKKIQEQYPSQIYIEDPNF